MNKANKIAVLLGYDAGNKYPWTVFRVGVVAEQGEYSFGNETCYFLTIAQACSYIESCIQRDMSDIENRINQLKFLRET